MKSSLMRTILVLLGLSVTGVGCGQRCFMTKMDFDHYNDVMQEAAQVAQDPLIPPPAPKTPTVSTVLSPERKQRPISLAECFALAVENGRIDGQSVRALAFDPAIAYTDVEQSLSKFDARWQTGMNWSQIDQPVGTRLQTLLDPTSNFINQQLAEFNTRLMKPLPTGGVAGITFKTPYQLTNLDQLNPTYQPVLEFSFEQPLLQGWGIENNQLRSAHPGGILNPLATGGAVPGILLTRNSFDQTRAEFEKRVQDLLFTVEQAYWNLYCSYWTLYSREIALQQVYREWTIAKTQVSVGHLTVQNLAAIEEQYEVFRSERLRALGNGAGLPGVLEAERQLRLVLGMPLEDGDRLIPSDTPTIAPYQPNWQVAECEALLNRPELVRARQEVQYAHYVLKREQNFLLPDLRMFSNWDLNGIGSRLDGPAPANAFRSLASNQFHNWSLGLRLDQAIGFREAHAQVRRARLSLIQRFTALKNLEEVTLSGLQRSYRQVIEAYEQVRIQRAREEVAAKQLKLRIQEFQAGLGITTVMLIAQRGWADALRDEQQAICEYNIALAEFERQKGTILFRDNITINEGPLPRGVLGLASENIRNQQRACVVRERPPRMRDLPSEDDCSLTLPTPFNPAPLPQLLEQQPKLPDHLPEVLPGAEVPPAGAASYQTMGKPQADVRAADIRGAASADISAAAAK